MHLEISEEHDDASDISDAVRRGIREADPPDVGHRDWEPLALALRDGNGSLYGGVYGATMWGWLMLDGIWVSPNLRGHGHGVRLLAAAESVAKARGCRGVSLGTFDFQARSFYERQGYRAFGQLNDFPSGHTHFQLAKRFDDQSSDPSRSPKPPSHDA